MKTPRVPWGQAKNTFYSSSRYSNQDFFSLTSHLELEWKTTLNHFHATKLVMQLGHHRICTFICESFWLYWFLGVSTPSPIKLCHESGNNALARQVLITIIVLLLIKKYCFFPCERGWPSLHEKKHETTVESIELDCFFSKWHAKLCQQQPFKVKFLLLSISRPKVA